MAIILCTQSAKLLNIYNRIKSELHSQSENSVCGRMLVCCSSVDKNTVHVFSFVNATFLAVLLWPKNADYALCSDME